MDVTSHSRALGWLWLALALALAIQAHSPMLHLSFVGDDYQWWEHARRAIEDPRLLPAAYGGFRPANTWSLALDHLLWGTNPVGYRFTCLALHLGCGLVLWGLLGRFAVRAPARAAVVALWLTAPWTRESVHGIVNRFQPMLMMCWLGLAWLWPGPDQRWTRRRVVAAAALAALTLFAKESWVILPGLVFCFQLWLRRSGVRRALGLALTVSLAPAIYVVLYALAPAIDRGAFYSAGLAGAWKLFHCWACFAYLTPFVPAEPRFGLPEALALACMLALAWLGWRRRLPLVGLGFTFYLLPFLPVLPVGWVSTRYTTIPFAGFLMLVLAAARELLGALEGRRRLAVSSGLALTVLLVLVAQLSVLRDDLRVTERYAALHERLLGEARAWLLPFPRDRQVVAIRLEQVNPLHELAENSEGMTFFVRGRDPYALIDWSALVSYTLDPEGGPLYETIEPGEASDSPFAVVAHVPGGFQWLEPETGSAREEVELWRQRGPAVRLLRPWKPAP